MARKDSSNRWPLAHPECRKLTPAEALRLARILYVEGMRRGRWGREKQTNLGQVIELYGERC